MFTGIIQAIGHITAIQEAGEVRRFFIEAGTLDRQDIAVGDSIAVSGVCLTVTAISDAGFWLDVSPETLARTVLGEMSIDSPVNLERAMLLGDRLDGHLVTGHVDGVGEVVSVADGATTRQLRIRAPDELLKYIAEKGSICVDGVSLTVNKIDGGAFELLIIPHTLKETVIVDYQIGSHVNLEADIIARYLESLQRGLTT